MEHHIRQSTPEISRSERHPGEYPLSPLASAGLQARNFTLASQSSNEIIAPDFFSENSLEEEFSRLCDPGEPITDSRLLNVVVKYFCAYLDDSMSSRSLSFAEIVEVFEGFGRHQSLNEPHDDIERMNRMRQWSGVLRMLADVPRMAHILRDVLGMNVQSPKSRFVGLDMGTASGMLLVGMAANARRNGYEEPLVRGFMNDPVAGERTHDLLRALGVGDVLAVSPSDGRAYAWLQGISPTLVVNEMLVGSQQPLGVRDFFVPYKTLASAAGPLFFTTFYPEGIIAYCREANMSMIITPDNGFQVPAEYMTSGLVAQGFLQSAQVMPTHLMGVDFYSYLASCE